MNAIRGAVVVIIALIIAVVVLARGLNDPEIDTVPPPPVTDTTPGSTAAAPPPESAPPPSESAPPPSESAPAPAPEAAPPPAPVPAVEPTPPPSDDEIPPPIPLSAVSPTHNRNEVRVLIANGTSVCGAAGRVATALSAEGYAVLPAVNADTDVDVSAIYYIEEYGADAAVVASIVQVDSSRILALPATPPTAPGDSHVLVHIGADDLAQPNC